MGRSVYLHKNVTRLFAVLFHALHLAASFHVWISQVPLLANRILTAPLNTVNPSFLPRAAQDRKGAGDSFP